MLVGSSAVKSVVSELEYRYVKKLVTAKIHVSSFSQSNRNCLQKFNNNLEKILNYGV